MLCDWMLRNLPLSLIPYIISDGQTNRFRYVTYEELHSVVEPNKVSADADILETFPAQRTQVAAVHRSDVFHHVT